MEMDDLIAAKHGQEFVALLYRIKKRIEELQNDVGVDYPGCDIVELFAWSDKTGSPKMGVAPTCPDDKLRKMILDIINEENK